MQEKKGWLRRKMDVAVDSTIAAFVVAGVAVLLGAITIYAPKAADEMHWLLLSLPYVCCTLWVFLAMWLCVSKMLVVRWRDRRIMEGVEAATDFLCVVPVQAYYDRKRKTVRVNIELFTPRPGGLKLTSALDGRLLTARIKLHSGHEFTLVDLKERGEVQVTSRVGTVCFVAKEQTIPDDLSGNQYFDVELGVAGLRHCILHTGVLEPRDM